MWSMLSLVTWTSLAVTALPPKPVPEPPVAVPAPSPPEGASVLDWGDSAYAMTLTSDGGYSAERSNGSEVWVGTWAWCAMTRTWAVDETLAGSVVRLRWYVVLDAATMAGDGKGDARVRIAIRKVVP